MKISRHLLPLFVLLIGVSPVESQERWLAIEGGTVFDGTGAIHEEATVLIRGDRIETIGPAGQVDIPAGAERLNATGKFLTPGLLSLIHI